MTLSAEQLQLLYYLLPAIFIGFFFGYLLSRAFSKEKYEPKLATLSKKISSKNIKIDQASKQQIQLESHIANQATLLLSSKKRVEDMEGLTQQFEQTAAALSSEKDTLQATLLQKEDEFLKLNKEVDITRDELVGIQNMAEKFKNETKNQKDKIFELENEMQMLTKGISKRDSLMSELEIRNQELKTVQQKNEEQQKAEIISRQILENEPTKKEKKLTLYKDDVLKYHGSVDINLLESIVSELGVTIYNPDDEFVLCTKKSDLDYVRESFLKKRLSIKGSDQALDASIKTACEKIYDKNRYRAVLYYILVKMYGKESIIK